MRIEKVSKSYGKKTVIQDVTVPIKEKSFTVCIGPNGAGKSTLLSMMSRLTPYDVGEIYISGTEVKAWKHGELAKKLSILKQSNSMEMRLTVRELVSFGRFPYTKGKLNKHCLKKIEEALQYLDLMEMADEYTYTLSGGQLQRVYIAMVLAQDTDYILLDEPLNNLDMNSGVKMMKTLRKMVDELDKTIVTVLHDINFAASYADEIVAMKNGKLFAYGTTEQMMTKEVLDSLYDMDTRIVDIDGKKICLYFKD